MGEEYTRRVTVVGSVTQQGDVVYADDFESTFRWTSSGDGTGNVSKSSSKSLSLANSMQAASDTGTPAPGQIATGIRRIHLPAPSKLQCGVSFFSTSIATIRKIILAIVWLDGTNVHTSRITYNGIDFKTYINQSSGDLAIANSALELRINTWHRMSFQLDFRTKKYISAIMDSQKFDISTLSYPTSANTNPGVLEIHAQMEIDTATTQIVYFDDVLLLTTI